MLPSSAHSADVSVPGVKIDVRDLSVTLGGVVIVRGVSFHAHAGRVTGVLGANGAGKSTLLRALVGLLPHRGQVLLDGRPLKDLERLQRAQLVAYVPQVSQLRATLRVAEVVAMGRYSHNPMAWGLREQDRTMIAAALTEMDVAHLAQRLYVTCSGGEQRRVLLARALATGAQTLVLDEPTASLDIRHRLDLLTSLRRLASAGRAVITVLHDIEEVRQSCDDALLLDRGVALTWGTAEAVLTRDNIRTAFGVDMVAGGACGYVAHQSG